MLLPLKKIKHVNSINHEGKIVIVVCDKDGQLFYTVRQEGHEQNYGKTNLKGWENWTLLPVPDQEQDQSVRKNEEKENSDSSGNLIIRSVYKTKDTTAIAPVQMISGMGHLYIFRQQKSGKLAVDRFVLDGMTNKLVAKLQVRFKRSRQKFEPLRKDKQGKDVMDSYDFRNADNQPFLEPSTELSILPETTDGWFSVVLLPTNEADQFRWHIFIYNKKSEQLELWSLASSQNGLFNIRDKSMNAGIIQRKFNLADGARITQGPVATKYDVQFERMTEKGPQLLRDKIRVMLVVPTSNQDMAMAINFSVDKDGFLSQIGDAEMQSILNSYTREILLPINSLDKIRGIGQDKAAGIIDALYKGEEDEVWVETDPDNLPEMGDEVEISGTKGFNGLHQVIRATKNTVIIEEMVNKLGDERIKLGRWEEKLDPNESLLFDGMITSYRKMAGNTIRVTSPKHGLKKGDQLQLIGSEEIDGTFEVRDINKDAFSIDMKWKNSQLVNIHLKSKQRRGIHFDAVGDAIKTPYLPLQNPTHHLPIGRTISAWVYPEDMSEGKQIIATNEYGLLNLLLINGIMHAQFNIYHPESKTEELILLADQTKIKPEWTHYSASYNFDNITKQTELFFMRDGEIINQKMIDGQPGPRMKSGLYFDGTFESRLSATQTQFFDLSQSDFTMEFWVKTRKGGPVLSATNYQEDHERKSLIINERGEVVFAIKQETILFSDRPINDNQWHHVALVASRIKKTLSLYIDGALEKDSPLPNMEKEAEYTRFSVGYAVYNWPEHQKNFEGSIDEIRVWKKARTAKNIQNFKDLRLAGNELGLKAYWSFEKEPSVTYAMEEGVKIPEYNYDNKAKDSNSLVNRLILKKGNTPLFKTPEWEEHYWIGGTEKIHAGFRNFRGKLSNVQIWDKALTTKAVRDNMHLELRGTESDLVVYYPMGGIIDNEVIDFSIHKLHGAVFGDPYYSERTLNRYILGDKPVEFYRNDELIAITQGAKYEETFEFRLLDAKGIAADPLNIGEKKAFEFYLWGKKSRGADEQIEEGFKIESETINPLTEGWHKATCQFYTPDNIRLLRLFGLKELEGDSESWTVMEVRKHKLTFFANAITLAPFTDEIKDLNKLADPEVDLGDLPRLNQLRRRYLKDKEKVEERLKTLQAIGSDENVIKARLQAIPALIQKSIVDRSAAFKNPLNYFCKIYIPGFFGNNFLTPPDTDTGELKTTNVVVEHLAQDGGKHYWWEFRHTGLKHYRIYRYKFPSNHSQTYLLDRNRVIPNRHGGSMGNKINEIKKESDRSISAKLLTGYYAYLHYEGGKVIMKSSSASDITRWTIEIGHNAPLSPSGEGQIKYYTDQIKSLNEEKETLEKKDKWVTLLNQINAKIEEIETAINLIITKFNETVTEQHNPEEMSILQEDNQRLVTRAAYLSFVKAASRLNIMESCEGNLLLSYFDTNGRMRQTVFDATADSRNSTFEQWLPESVKSCLDFSKGDNSLVKLNSQISLGHNWTIEFWFSYPLANVQWSNGIVNKHHVFIGGDESNPESRDKTLQMSSPAMVLNRVVGEDENNKLEIQELGIYKAGYVTTEEGEVDIDFMGTGYDMNQLSHGWHHMAVQGSGTGSRGTVNFFIDGQKVGDDIRTKYFIDSDIEEEKNQDSTKTSKRTLFKDYNFNYTGRMTGIGNFGAVGMNKPSFHIRDFKVSQMAEVRLWDVVLTPEEIEINSRSYLSGNEPGLVAYYPLSEGQGNVIRNHAAYHSLEQDTNAQLFNARWIPSTAPIGHPGDRAILFDGIQDKIVFEQTMTIPESYGIELWFKAEDIKNIDFVSQPFSIFSLMSSSGTLGVYVLNEKLVISYDMGSGQGEIFELKSISDNTWHHLSLSIDKGMLYFYFDGELKTPNGHAMVSGEQFAEDQRFSFSNNPVSIELGLNASLSGISLPHYKGQMADFRIWGYHRTTKDIQKLRFRRLIGNETGLLLYCPLDEVTDDHRIINFSSKNYGKTVQTGTHRMKTIYTNDLPIGLDAVVVNEYPTVAFDPETNKQTAMMWRFLATPKVDKLHLLTQKRIELLEQIWIGNGQFDPTLLGFIEGPPPVPSENLTVEDDYSGATSVGLNMSQNTEYNWERTQDIYTELDLAAKLGASLEIAYGFALGGFASASAEVKAMGGIAANFKYGAQNSTAITSSSGLNLNDSIEIRGSKEEYPAFEHLGPRYLPKNIGYALVISSMADVYIVRLKRSKKMVSYKILPIDGIPPQVNTITFLINPAYCLNGSLDGQVGTAAADERFYSHVPEMRLQFGSKYPASYMKLEQAIALQSSIDQLDKEREAYYENFNSRLVDETSLDRDIGNANTNSGIDVGDDKEDVDIDHDAIDSAGEDAEARADEEKEEATASLDKYQTMADSNSKSAGLFTWQEKMEKLLLKAGKQNIVNSYVWDADGGLHVSSESFANSITHSIGGSFSFSGALTFDLEVNAIIGVELGIAAGVGVDLTMTKSETSSKEVSLDVDLGGMEYRGITDHKDRPLLPGEKVDRYRFSSFFLEGNTNHFNDFFNYVVDPEWLASNDEEARALRSINVNKPNKTWRVLHRVTYVERPALMGFGKDTRPYSNGESSRSITEQVEQLDTNLSSVEKNTEQLKRQVAKLERALTLTKDQNVAMADKLESILNVLKQKQNENVV